jgi:two-component system, response regulator PdtaR
MRANTVVAAIPQVRDLVVLAISDRLALTALGGELSAAGFDVVETWDCQSALDACVARRPALAIIDYSTPDSGGTKLSRSIAERMSIPTIIVSACGDEAAIAEAVNAGAVNYLLKPVDTKQVIAAVRTALQRAAETLALRRQANQLTEALQSGRSIGVAIGFLMAQFHISQQEALERLRRHARSKRARLEDVALDLLSAAEQMGQIYSSFSH